jgi:hypothetical protein
MAILRDGFRALIGFQLLPGAGGLNYQEVTLKLPNIDGRGPVDQTSMRNSVYTTQLPHYLITLGELTGTMMYSPAFWAAASGVMNRNQLVTLVLPDNSTFQFWGWINMLEPTEFKEGERPLLNFNVQVSNINTQCLEEGPTFTAGDANPCLRI